MQQNPHTQVIIDANEFSIERASSILSQSSTFSPYMFLLGHSKWCYFFHLQMVYFR